MAGGNRVGHARALVGAADEFLCPVLAPGLLGDLPEQAGMRAQASGEMVRIGHGFCILD